MLPTLQFEIAQLVPIMFVIVLFFVFSRTLVLPEGYFKDKMIREAMLKRRAEREDLDRMAQERALMQLQSDEDDEG